MKNVFVSIINFNGRENTFSCLAELDKIKIQDFSITVIVIDNASEEKFDIGPNFLKNMPLVFIRNSENLGFAEGHNVGIRYALGRGADYVIILNNDTLLDKNFAREMVEAASKDSKVGIVGPKIYFAKGFEYHKGRYEKEDLGKVFWYAGGQMDWKNVIGHHRGVDEVDRGQYDNTFETDYVSGCCMLITRKTLEKVGTFDKKYFLYYEDNDLSQRARKHGFKIIYEPRAVIWHKNAGSAGGSGSSLQDYYITRNRMLFGINYAPIRSKVALIRESIKLIKSGRKWQRIGIMDFYRRKFGKGSYRIEP
ncbi:MAG: glycosyltransferase family 2 protein [Candidatus Levybacteria bacterium]|nr:glycosyltransferase family 2 protein [Candidatus Levybacteria bacterium]